MAPSPRQRAPLEEDIRRVDFVGTNRKPALFREDASFVYRCENPAFALRAAGWGAGLAHVKGYPLGHGARGARGVVLHRPLDSLGTRWLVRRIRRAGIRVLIDVDDLIFDPRFASCSPAVVNGILPLAPLERRFASHRRALQLADEIVVSTEPLAEHVREAAPGVPVTVIANSVHMRWRGAEPADPRDPGARRIITYAPGTRSHDRDFRGIARGLERFLDAHPEVELHITGHLNHPLMARDRQVVHRAKVPFPEYAEYVRAGWVNLCPLEPTPFNRCKSALKVIEAGFWNIPTICSPNPDTRRFVGAGAILAEGEDEWVGALERLLDDAEYARITEGLRERVLALADPRAQAERLLARVEGGR